MQALEQEQDLEELRAAAEEGSSEAAMRICHYSIHVVGDESEGIHWYLRAIAAGHPHSAGALGIQPPVYKDLWGKTEIPPIKKLSQERGLAKAGDPAAQYRLGALFANGGGVSLDFVQAYAWFVVAARPGLDPFISNPSNYAKHAKHDEIPDWGTASRAVRLLEQVMEDEELELAKILAVDYLSRYGGGVSRTVKLFYVMEKWKSVLFTIAVMLPVVVFLTIWDQWFPPKNRQ